MRLDPRKIRRDFNLHLEGAKEILKRYDQVYIPKAKDAFQASQDPNDQKFLDNVIKGKQIVGCQIARLEAYSTRCTNYLSSADDFNSSITRQRKLVARAVVVHLKDGVRPKEIAKLMSEKPKK